MKFWRFTVGQTRRPRTALLVLAVTAMGGTWMIEQPRSSTLLWHPRIRLLWRLLPKVRVAKPTVSIVLRICFFREWRQGMEKSICLHVCVKSFYVWLISYDPSGLWSQMVGRYVWGWDVEATYRMVEFPNNSVFRSGYPMHQNQKEDCPLRYQVDQTIQIQIW